ncbi:MAG TPA: hypothetical protein VI913_05505 [Candidatus Peribacteraceae bacterium]|nr:hypothetical protein [Candidatus Peribacteraceae bacterium]
MPTSKKRLNITLSKELAIFLKSIALRDDVPQAAKAVELLEKALELEEDDYFNRLAEEREKAGGRFIPHDTFWSKIV